MCSSGSQAVTVLGSNLPQQVHACLLQVLRYLVHVHRPQQHHCCLAAFCACVCGCAAQVQLTTAVRCDLSRYQAFLKLVGFKDAPPRVRHQVPSTKRFHGCCSCDCLTLVAAATAAFSWLLQLPADMHLSPSSPKCQCASAWPNNLCIALQLFFLPCCISTAVAVHTGCMAGTAFQAASSDSTSTKQPSLHLVALCHP